MERAHMMVLVLLSKGLFEKLDANGAKLQNAKEVI